MCTWTWGSQVERLTTSASRVSISLLQCASPRPPHALIADIQVTVAGTWHGVHRFHFYESAMLSTVRPLVGPEEGGTIVTLTSKSDHSFRSSAICRFGIELAVGIHLPVANRLACLAPPIGGAAVRHVPIFVSNNGQQFVFSEHHFSYLRRLLITSIWPTSGPADGGTFVRIGGVGFSQRPATLSHLLCKFNVSVVPAIFISAAEIACYSPEVAAGVAALEISMNVPDFSMGGMFTYLSMRVIGIHPSKGAISGGTEIHIRTTNSVAGNDLHCKFLFDSGSEICVPAKQRAVNVLACVSPAYPEVPNISQHVRRLSAAVRLIIHEAQLLSISTFEYLLPVHLIRIEPRNGPIFGGTTITVRGSWFPLQSPQHCVFSGNALYERIFVLAEMVTSTSLECVTPPFSQPYSIITLHAVGAEYQFESHLLFTYHPILHVVELLPSHGPLHGGSHLQVRGRFSYQSSAQIPVSVTCRLNSTTVPATSRGPQQIVCISPAQPLGYVNVEISLNFVDWSESDFHFEYVDPGIHEISPNRGPFAGHTLILIRATQRFTTTVSTLRCLFGEQLMVNASQPSLFTVTCTSPAWPRAHENVSSSIPVQLLADSAVLNMDHILFFRYEPEGVILTTSPLSGPIAGGTNIFLNGAFPWTQSSDCICAFWTRLQQPQIVVAQHASSNQVKCVSPTHSAGFAFIRLSSNGQNFTVSYGVFQFHDPPSMISIDPPSGPMNGHVKVKISFLVANDISSSFQTHACRFGEVVALATYHSQTMVSCLAPPRTSPRLVSVEVSANMQQFVGGTGTALLFRYEDRQEDTVLPSVSSRTGSAAKILSLSPTSGPQEGGTTLSIVTARTLIRAEHFFCHFSSPREKVAIVPAFTESSREAKCVTPPLLTSLAHVALIPSLRLHAVATEREALPFNFDPTIIPLSLSPRQGSPRGGTRVRITVESIPIEPRSLRCRFNTTEVVAWRDGTNVLCQAPPSAGEDIVSICISYNDGVDYSSICPMFEYVFTRLASAMPSIGPRAGGTHIAVRTSANLLGNDYVCVFGRTNYNHATLDSASSLRCITPAAPEDISSSSLMFVTLLVDGSIASASPLHFFSFPELIVSSLNPTSAPASGGSMITITLGLKPHSAPTPSLMTSTARCRVGGVQIAAIWLSAKSFRCILPEFSLNSNKSILMPVQVGLNGQQWSEPGPSRLHLFGESVWEGINEIYMTRSPAILIDHFPESGPASGSRTIRVNGYNFHSLLSLMCAFGQTPVLTRATIESPTHATCLSPAYLPNSNVELRLIRSPYAEQATYRYTFRAQSIVSQIQPNSGPVSGGTTIRIYGANLDLPFAFLNASLLIARRISTSELRCTSSEATYAELANVGVASRSDDDRHASTFFFSYHERMHCYKVEPEEGPAQGGSFVAVWCHGISRHACLLDQVRCKFGTEDSPATCDERLASIACLSPMHDVGFVSIDISQNYGTDYSSTGLFFHYVRSFSGLTAELSPVAGPSAGGTLLTLACPVRTSSTLLCLLIDNDHSSPASLVSGGYVRCVTPPRRSTHRTSVELIADRVRVAQGWFDYHVRAPPHESRLLPAYSLPKLPHGSTGRGARRYHSQVGQHWHPTHTSRNILATVTIAMAVQILLHRTCHQHGICRVVRPKQPHLPSAGAQRWTQYFYRCRH